MGTHLTVGKPVCQHRSNSAANLKVRVLKHETVPGQPYYSVTHAQRMRASRFNTTQGMAITALLVDHSNANANSLVNPRSLFGPAHAVCRPEDWPLSSVSLARA